MYLQTLKRKMDNSRQVLTHSSGILKQPTDFEHAILSSGRAKTRISYDPKIYVQEEVIVAKPNKVQESEEFARLAQKERQQFSKCSLQLEEPRM